MEYKVDEKRSSSKSMHTVESLVNIISNWKLSAISTFYPVHLRIVPKNRKSWKYIDN